MISNVRRFGWILMSLWLSPNGGRETHPWLKVIKTHSNCTWKNHNMLAVHLSLLFPEILTKPQIVGKDGRWGKGGCQEESLITMETVFCIPALVYEHQVVHTQPRIWTYIVKRKRLLTILRKMRLPWSLAHGFLNDFSEYLYTTAFWTALENIFLTD